MYNIYIYTHIPMAPAAQPPGSTPPMIRPFVIQRIFRPLGPRYFMENPPKARVSFGSPLRISTIAINMIVITSYQ